MIALAAAKKGASLIHKVRTYLSAILDEAMEQRFLSSNPARKLDKPEVGETAKPVLTRIQVWQLLATLQGRDCLIFRLLVCCGFRPGELFVLRWNDWEPGQLRIDEAIWQGHIGKPKTVGSATVVYIPPQAEKELAEWKIARQPVSDEEFIFTDGCRPLNKREWMEESLRPGAASLKIPLVTYQVLHLDAKVRYD